MRELTVPQDLATIRAEQASGALDALCHPDGARPLTADDFADRDFATEMLVCYRAERARALAASGWVETPKSEALGRCIRAVAGSL